MGKKPGATAEELLKTTPRGTRTRYVRIISARWAQPKPVYVRRTLTMACAECGTRISTESPRTLCYDCDHADDRDWEFPPDYVSPNQRRKQARKARRAARQQVVVPASGVSLEEAVEEFLEAEYATG
jgi:hypothetical protein